MFHDISTRHFVRATLISFLRNRGWYQKLYEERRERGREINSGATQSDTEWQRIRTANRKIRVLIVRPWCWYATRRKRSDSEEAVDYSAKRQVSIGRFGLVCWFWIVIEQDRVREHVCLCLVEYAQCRGCRNRGIKRRKYRSISFTHFALLPGFPGKPFGTFPLSWNRFCRDSGIN